jgi:hypothetical protein
MTDNEALASACNGKTSNVVGEWKQHERQRNGKGCHPWFHGKGARKMQWYVNTYVVQTSKGRRENAIRHCEGGKTNME